MGHNEVDPSLVLNFSRKSWPSKRSRGIDYPETTAGASNKHANVEGEQSVYMRLELDSHELAMTENSSRVNQETNPRPTKQKSKLL